MKKFKIHSSLSNHQCDYLIDTFKDTKTNEGLSVKTIGDSRIFGFERFINKDLSNLIFNLDSEFIHKSCNIKPVFQTLMMNHTAFDKKAKGSGEGWHRDSCIKKQFKTIFYLVAVNSKNGPFMVYDKFNILNFLFKYKRRFSDSFIRMFSPILPEPTVFTSENRGFGFSINTNLLHRGAKIFEGERYAITVYSYLDHPSDHVYNLSKSTLTSL